MTNQQKADVRYYIKHEPELSDKFVAEVVGCHPSTVKRYREAYLDSRAKPAQETTDR